MKLLLSSKSRVTLDLHAVYDSESDVPAYLKMMYASCL